MIAAVALLCLFPSRTMHAEVVTKRLAPGITYTQEIDTATPLIINVVKVDLDATGVKVGVGLGQDKVMADDPTHGREAVDRHARRRGALVAVNADYFPYTGDPLGLGIRDGEIFSEPWTPTPKIGPRAVMGIGQDDRRVRFDIVGFLGDFQAADGSRIAISGVNRSAGQGEIVAFTEAYGDRTGVKAGGTEVVLNNVNLPLRPDKLMTGIVESVQAKVSGPARIPAGQIVLGAGTGKGTEFLLKHCHPGDNVVFVLAVAPLKKEVDGVRIAALPAGDRGLPSRGGAGLDPRAVWWSRVQHAVGGGPRLLQGGKLAVDAAAEGFDSGFADLPHARTAVGTSADGRTLYLVTVDGGQELSRGVSLTQLAGVLKRYGATEGMNLDGGGSTTMSVAGMLVSSPGGDGRPRPVADMLVVTSDGKQPAVSAKDPDEVSISFPAAPANGAGGPGAPSGAGSSSGASSGVGGASDAVPGGGTIHIEVTDPSRPTAGQGQAGSQGNGDPAGQQPLPGSSTPAQTVPGSGVSGQPMPAAQPHLSIASPAMAGTAVPVVVHDGARAVPSSSADVIWKGPVGDIGFVTQKGVFIATRAGSGSITALYKGRELKVPVVVAEDTGPAAELHIASRMTLDPQNPAQRSLIQVQITRADGTPVSGTTVHFAVTGGAADQADVATTEDGDAGTGITWSGAQGGQVIVSIGNTSTTVVRQ